MIKPLGIQFAARVAMHMARDVLGRREAPRGRDYTGVKSIACVLMRETGASLPDIAECIYGRRNMHSAVYDQINKWRDDPSCMEALETFSEMLSEE